MVFTKTFLENIKLFGDELFQYISNYVCHQDQSGIFVSKKLLHGWSAKRFCKKNMGSSKNANKKNKRQNILLKK